MILEVSWDGLWTLSIGLSQIHGHGLTALGLCVKWPLLNESFKLFEEKTMIILWEPRALIGTGGGVIS